MHSRAAGGLGVWFALTAVAAAAVAAVNFLRVRDGFEVETRTLHRIVSQRADQHDAHLTSLAAVLATPDRSFATFDAVTEAVLRFYPGSQPSKSSVSRLLQTWCSPPAGDSPGALE
jgi:hypothetical protein